jgi:hypothetical protein
VSHDNDVMRHVTHLYVSPIVAMGWWIDGYMLLGKLLLIGIRLPPFAASRLWFRSFSSRRHFARLLLNQTYKKPKECKQETLFARNMNKQPVCRIHVHSSTNHVFLHWHIWMSSR